MPEDTASTIAAVAIRQAVARLDRRTRWELVGLVPLTFATHHPQGLVFVGEHTFLSSVEILENPSLPANSNRRTPGRGIGHLFVLGKDGTLLRDLRLGEGDMYHPGGIDFDGSKIWVSVAEYRDRSASLILTIDPMSFDVTERFRVPDHVGWVVCDSAKKTVYAPTETNWITGRTRAVSSTIKTANMRVRVCCFARGSPSCHRLKMQPIMSSEG
jgi:hypothetical protein